MHTVSTDDAYVAAYVTYIAPRIPSTILKIYVDGNQFVNQGQLIIELDPELYQIGVDRAAVAVVITKAQVQQAKTQSRAIVASIRAAYNKLKLTVDHVTEGIAKLKASLVTRAKTIAQRAVAKAELRRAKNPLQSNSRTQEVVDQRQAAYQVAAVTEIEAHEQVHLARAALGLPTVPPLGQELDDVPKDWPQKAPAARAARTELINVGVNIALQVPPIKEDPDTVYNNFVKSAPGGDLDSYLNQLVEKSPAVQLACAGWEQAPHALDQAKLDLCDTKIHAEISGFIVHRIANPGNCASAGQGLMGYVRRRASGSTPTLRKLRSPTYRSVKRSRSVLMPIPADCTAVGSLDPALAREQPQHACLRRMPRATSSRWSSGFQCPLTWWTAIQPMPLCSSAFQSSRS